jgi:hypothetical protein
LGDLLVDGSSTISVNETVTGVLQVDGNCIFGNNSGDSIALGGGTTDTCTLNTHLTVGAGLVTIGSSISNYVLDLWLDAVNTNGPALAAYNLNATGTNAGAYTVGIDPTLLANATATDLMTALDQLDAAIGGGSATGTNNLTFTINEDGAAGTPEDPALLLEGGDGGTSLITTSLVQDSTADLAYLTIDNNGTQISPVLSLGDATGSTSTGISPVLRWTATNTTPSDLVADLSLSVIGAASTGLLQFSGSGLLAVGLNAVPLRIDENAGNPGTISNAGFVYTKDVSTVTELFYLDSSGNAVQITTGGSVVGGAADTLQTAYAAGNTIAVTGGNGIITLSNNTNADTTTVLSIGRAPGASTAGTGLDVSLGANTTGIAVNIAQAGTGAALFVNNTGTGAAFNLQDGGSNVLLIDGAGAIDVTPTSGQNYSLTTLGAGTIALSAAAAVTIDSTGAGISIDAAGASNFSTSAGNLTLDSAAAELVFDDTGNSGLTLSQVGDRTLDQTAAGEVLNGVTSAIGAVNSLARAIMEDGTFTAEFPIENTVTIAAGQVVAASTVSGRVTQANANAETNTAVIGIAITGGTGDVGGTVLSRFALPGAVVTVSGGVFTAGAPVFAPDGTGIPTATAPSGNGDRVIRLGYALTATQFVFQPIEGFTL